MKTQKSAIRAFAALTAVSAVLFAPATGCAKDTDARIATSAQDTHVFRTYLKDDKITVRSTNGTVTLTGVVADDFNKALAQDTVESLPGVREVDNQLTIAPEAPLEYSDAWVTLKVKSVLMMHRNVSAVGTQVTTADGVVILRGTASSLAQKELTGEYAADVAGVKRVRNDMVLAKLPAKPEATTALKIDDASITAQVRTSLKTHKSTSAAKTMVQTTDGVVTVGGVAKNAAERSLVSKLVSDIHGVTQVNNNMTLEIASNN
jgi:hyperosmotically inducible periplasmic protein